MAIIYQNNEIKLLSSDQKFNVDVVYARPEDIIKLDFLLENVKVTFINGDLDIIFPNGSVISLASYGTLAFDNNAPKIYDLNDNLITLEALLQKVQVLSPEDSILILADRDKNQLVQNQDQIDRILTAGDQTITNDSLGVIVSGVGEANIKTIGVISNIVDINGNSYNFNLNKGIGDYINNTFTNFLRGSTDNDNILPGNTTRDNYPKLVYSFLFGDAGVRGSNRSINGQAADYYGIIFGIGENNKINSQLDPIEISGLGGQYQNKIFDAHSADGKIKRILKLDYSGGIFPQSIVISGIPGELDSTGKKIFDLVMQSGGTTNLTYDAARNVYYLSQLDMVGRIKLNFIFNDNVPDQTIVIKYTLIYYDPKTSVEKLMESSQDVGIRSISQRGDLNLNSFVLNKGVAGLIVTPENAGTGNKIFIGGSIVNNFHSRAGDSLVFLGSGNDTIDLESGSNLIYGSIGYNIITGSGTKNNWLVFSNEKKYNENFPISDPDTGTTKYFMQSDAIRDSYYNTLKRGTSLQFYLGVPQKDVLNLWDQLGYTGDPGKLKDYATSNFVRSFSSMTVIGNRNESISITNIVGSKELDTFNLYFQGVIQKVNLYSGEKNIPGLTNQIFLHTIKDNDVLVNFGGSDLSNVTSKDGAVYSFQTYYFNKITTKGNANFTVNLWYNSSNSNAEKDYRKDGYFVAGEGEVNTVDFSRIKFLNPTRDCSLENNGHIEFDADARYNLVRYFCVKGKNVDYFQRFNYIVGSKGNDIFYGNSNSTNYTFDGYEGINTLTYEKSISGITFDATEQKIYKISSKDIQDYSKYKKTADLFTNIQEVKLSYLDNVFLAAHNVNIGKNENGNYDLWLGGANNTLRYDYDPNITSIIVYSDDLKVKKVKDDTSPREDNFKKNNIYGTIEFIGAKGSNIFYGGIKYSDIFNGKESSDNILSYEMYTSIGVSIAVDLFKNTVFKAGKTDIYINIQKIIGGKGNDSFTLGNIDPTNETQLGKIKSIQMIDGGEGSNILRFNSIDTSNLTQTGFALVYDVDSGKISFFDKNTKSGDDPSQVLDLNIKNISIIYGTLARNRFIASPDKDFTFDGVGLKDTYDPNDPYILPNTLDYSNFENNLIIDLVKEIVIKDANQQKDDKTRQDHFKNIQAFIGGKGNDTFLSTYSLEKKVLIFDGNQGDNTLKYQNISNKIEFDFSQGSLVFNSSDSKIKHYFFNITKFIGSNGENIFKLSQRPSFFTKEKSGVNIDLGSEKDNSRVIIDFDLWDDRIGTQESPFKVSAGASSISNGQEGKDRVTYNWFIANGFIGSKKGNYFTFEDSEDGLNTYKAYFELDGNREAEESVLDYSNLNVNDLSLDVNISDGSVLKITKTSIARDIIHNFKTLKLSKNNDTVKLLDNVKDNLKTLQLVDGNEGKNCLDFSLLTKDLDVIITKAGLNFSNIGNLKITFINFKKMLASKGNSIFRVTSDSIGADVEILGNTNLSNDKFTILDLTAIKDIKFWNLNAEDNPSDFNIIGKLTWGSDESNSAKIVNKDISQVKIGDGKNTIYGSLYNHTHYIGTNESGTINSIDYSNIGTKDSITVTIFSNKQSAKFNNNGTKDDFTNFHYFLTSEGNDTFTFASLENIGALTLDGNKGDNTLSFSLLNKNIDIDISLDKLEIEKTSLTILNVDNLILTQHNDTIVVSDSNKKDLLFKTVNGFKGTNIFDVRDGSVITFNEKDDNKLLLSNHNEIKISNFYNLRTNSVTGNRFFNNYNTNMKFDVVGITNDSGIKNFLSYRNSTGVKIDFNKSEVYKGSSDSVDKFGGINYFEGSISLINTFYLAKALGNSSNEYFNQALKTIYINIDPANSGGENTYKDIIDISLIGDNALLFVDLQQLENSEVQYKWNNIGIFRLTNNQTIYVSFDENLKYVWVAPEESSNDNKSSNAALVFSSKHGKDGKEYENGYVVVDTLISKANTYDVNGKQLAEINFVNISVIKGTGNSQDIFYGSIHNIEYYSSDTIKKGFLYPINPKDGTYGSGTLSYQKFFNDYGIKIIFNVDNSASIIENTSQPTRKLDKSYGIHTYIGTTKDDSFVIAKNKNAGKITIDGYSGSFNNVDYSSISTDGKGMVLDTTLGISIGDFDYIFKNINVFKLTQDSDTVLGSLDNKGFINENSNADAADIILDAGEGTDNTIDYSKYLIGTKDNIIKVNADLNLATITKEGKNKDGKLISSSDIIATLNTENNTTNIKFQKIILNGEYVSNILTVSGRDSDMAIYVEINNPTDGIIQFINFEFINTNIDIVWDGQKFNGNNTNIFLTKLNRKLFSFIGFNSVLLSKSDSKLTITKDAALISTGGRLDGGGGKNTLVIAKNDNKDSSVLIRSGIEEIELDLKGGAKCIYNIANFHYFELGCMNNRFFTQDTSNFIIEFVNTLAFNEINFTELNSTYIVLDFQKISDYGANAVVSKQSLFNGKIIGKDTLIGFNNLVLTNNNDTIEIVESEIESSGRKITIDGGAGYNTLSFQKWNSVVDLSKINDKGHIEINIYILKNFSNIVLRDKDDEILLNENSILNIDGGGGNNKITYSGDFSVGNEPGGVTVQEIEKVQEPGQPIINGTLINKSSGKTDTLLRFNYFILPENCNNIYIALFVNIKADNPSVYNIDFNYTDRQKSRSNTMDYSKLRNNKSSILVDINANKPDKPLIEVFRDQTKRFDDKATTTIKDRLFNLNNIIGSAGGGDTFNIKGEYNTNLTINASYEKVSNLYLTIANSRLPENNTTIWHLYGTTKTIQQSTQPSGSYLNFNGNITNIEITSTPKGNSQADNEFIIKNIDEAYNIIYKVTSNRTRNAIYGKLNLTEFQSDNEIKISVKQVTGNTQLQFVRIDISQENSKTTSIFGVEYILGSLTARNAFHIKNQNISRFPNNIVYLIGNTTYSNNGDYIEIEGSSYLTNMDMVVEEQFGGIRLISVGGKNADYYLKNIYIFSISDIPQFTFNITNSPVLSNRYTFNVTGSTRLFINIDESINNLEAILDRNGIYFSDNKLGLTFTANKIDDIKSTSTKPNNLSIVVRNPDLTTPLTFDIFSNINLEDYLASHNVSINVNSSTWSIKVNNLTFTGASNISPILYLSKISENSNKSRNVNISIDFKNIKSLWENINIYAPIFFPKHILNFVLTSTVAITTTIDITEQVFNMVNRNGTISKGNVIWHNVNNLNSIKFENSLNHKFNFEFNNFTEKLDIFINHGASLKINFGNMTHVKSAITIYSYQIVFGNITFHSNLPGFINFNNYNIDIILPNFIEVDIGYKITSEYVKGLLKGLNTSAFSIKAINMSDTENTLISNKLVGELFTTDIPEDHTLKVTLDYNINKVLNFIFQGIVTDTNKFIKANYIIYGIKVTNPAYLGFWSASTEYTITNIVQPLILGYNLKPNTYKKLNSSVVFAGKDDQTIDINGGNIEFTLNVFQGGGMINGYSLVTQNITKFDFSKITNCKDFLFNVPAVYTGNNWQNLWKFDIKAVYYPDSKIKLTNLANLKDFPSNIFEINAFAGIVNNLSLKIDERSAVLDISANDGATENKGAFRLENFTKFTLSTRFNIYVEVLCTKTVNQLDGTLINKDIDISYILTGIEYNNSGSNELTYIGGKIEYGNGIVKKNNKVYDLVSGFKNILITKATDAVLYFTNIKHTFFTDNKNINVYDFKVIGDDITNVFINLEYISKKDNNVVIYMESIKSLSFTCDKEKTYLVFCVNDSKYCNKNNDIAHFDTKGYFVIFDSVSKMKLYFTGKDIEKFGKEFEKVTNQNIKLVDSYKELIEIIKDPSLSTDIFINETKSEIEDTYLTINYENTNHSSYVFFEEEEEDQNTEDFDTLYEETQMRELDSDEASPTFNDINYNTTEEDLNILTEEEDINTLYNSIISPDILEFTDDIDSIFNSSKDEFLEISNNNEGQTSISNLEVTYNNHEDTNDFLEVIEELNSIEDINSYKNDTILISESAIDDEPSSKIEDSMHKQNTINGNYYK